VTDRTLQRRCRSRAWQRRFHGDYATTSKPLIRPALLTAALLYGGPYATLSQRADTVLDMAVAEPTAHQVGGSPA